MRAPPQSLVERLEKAVLNSVDPLHGPIPEGKYACDMHVHSSASHEIPDFDEYSPLGKMVLAFERGMHYFTLTDHETYSGVLELQEQLSGLGRAGEEALSRFIPGVEVNLHIDGLGHAIHTNVYGLEERHWKDIENMYWHGGSYPAVKDAEALFDYLEDEGLAYQFNHPIYKSVDPGQMKDIASGVLPFFKGSDDNPLSIADLVLLIPQFPMVEVNGSRLPVLNDVAEYFARLSGIPLTGGSDDHYTVTLANCYTVAEGDTWQDYLQNVVDGRSEVARGDADEELAWRRSEEVVDMVFGGRCDTAKYLGMILNTELPWVAKRLLEHWNPKWLPYIRKTVMKAGVKGFLQSQYSGLPQSWIDDIEKGRETRVTTALHSLLAESDITESF